MRSGVTQPRRGFGRKVFEIEHDCPILDIFWFWMARWMDGVRGIIVRSKGGNVTRSLEVWVKIRVRELSRVARREKKEIDGGIEFENSTD